VVSAVSTNAGADVIVAVEPDPAPAPVAETDRWSEVMATLGQLAQRVGALEGAAVSQVEAVVGEAERAAQDAHAAAAQAEDAAVSAQVAAIDAEIAVLDAEDAAEEADDAAEEADETDETPDAIAAGSGDGEPPVPIGGPAAVPASQDEAPRKAHWIHRKVIGKRG
jgi:hypothetical protein